MEYVYNALGDAFTIRESEQDLYDDAETVIAVRPRPRTIAQAIATNNPADVTAWLTEWEGERAEALTECALDLYPRLSLAEAKAVGEELAKLV